MSRPLLQTPTLVKEKRLELGKKVFKVPTQSKRRSSRIQRPEAKSTQAQKKTDAIVHHLLLAPTLKRQRRKKLEREKNTNNQLDKASEEWNWKRIAKGGPEIKISEVFQKKRGRQPRSKNHFKGSICNVLDDTDVQVHISKKIKHNIDFVKIRHVARCGGTKFIPGLNIYNDEQTGHERKSDIPLPFEAKIGDRYIIPKSGQLISYLWHSRPSPVLGIKQIYRTGVLCSNDGTIRFFESEDENGGSEKEKKNENVDKKSTTRKFYEGKFYLNKQVFKKGNFRVRTDLFVGAICYEREMKMPCKIIKIDEQSGAVLVESLQVQHKDMDNTWISPDDLVGYQFPKTSNDQEIMKVKNSVSADPDETKNNTERIGQFSQRQMLSVQKCIDLTQDDECDEYDSNQISIQYSNPRPNGIGFEPKSPIRLETQIPKNALISPSYPSQDIDTISVPSAKVNENYTDEKFQTVARVDALSRYSFKNCSGVGNQILSDGKFTSNLRQPSLTRERLQPDTLRFENDNSREKGILNTSSSMLVSTPFGAPFHAPITPDRYATIGSSNFASAHSGTSIQSQLLLLKQHGIALEILMSATDLGTILASLQYIKRAHERGIPMGPTAAKVVKDAELTSRVLMEDTFLRQMTSPKLSGGNGYNVSQAGMILCRLAPILGPNLGRLDSPTIDSTRLLSLGLNAIEVLDLLPYIQSFEDDVLMKTLSLKRQLANVCQGQNIQTPDAYY